MCGRFTLSSPADVVAEWFKLAGVPPITPRFNIAPTQMVSVIMQGPGKDSREWAEMKWGLIPPWAKDPAIGNRMINARSETAAEKPSFRSPLKKNRCLIPATGFYEWKKEESGKQPYLIGFGDETLFAMAGLWATWKDPDGGMVESCTILTTSPNKMMESLHNRMPVIVDPSDYNLWLTPEPLDEAERSRLFSPFPGDDMAAIPVSKYVNSPTHEDAKCIVPLSE